uniref:ORF238 n=1 Tax=Pyropia endiviifolia TaxID=1699272 RepID=A0A1U6ZGI1_9RHOD|nr:ORF238 [Pyropia endiviifolia]
MQNQIRVQLLELNQNTKPNSIKKQLEIIETIQSNDSIHLKVLADLLCERISTPNYNSNCVDGFIYQKLLNSKDQEIVKLISSLCPDGIVPLRSAKEMDYKDLQALLATQELVKADQLTQQKLIQLAGVNAQNRNWLYFTDINRIPAQDLQTIDKLWHTHSQGKFGIFVQRQIWLSAGKDWEKFWKKIEWEIDHVPCRYPDEFQWSSYGPKGHLPLFNQLRGVQVLSALLNHKAWEDY